MNVFHIIILLALYLLFVSSSIDTENNLNNYHLEEIADKVQELNEHIFVLFRNITINNNKYNKKEWINNILKHLNQYDNKKKLKVEMFKKENKEKENIDYQKTIDLLEWEDKVYQEQKNDEKNIAMNLFNIYRHHHHHKNSEEKNRIELLSKAYSTINLNDNQKIYIRQRILHLIYEMENIYSFY